MTAATAFSKRYGDEIEVDGVPGRGVQFNLMSDLWVKLRQRSGQEA